MVKMRNDDSDFIGVLVSVVDFEKLDKMIKNIKIDGGYAYLLDQNYKILFYPAKNMINQKISTLSPLLKKIESSVLKKHRGVFNYKTSGKDKIAAFDTIKATGWKLVVVVDKDIAYKELNDQFYKRLIATISFIILGTLLLIFVLNRLFVPIKRLRSMVNDLANKDADLISRIETKGDDILA